MRSILILFFLLIAPGLVLAHEAQTGPNGGWKVDAGDKNHVEAVFNNTNTVSVFVSDDQSKPVSAQGYRGNALLIVGGKTIRVSLSPAEGSRLTGVAPAPVAKGTKGVIQLTLPDGSTVQGKL